MVARTYVCQNKCEPKVVSEPITFVPTCSRCGDLMIEGEDE